MAAWTSSLTVGLTRGDRLTTREAVARETPAMRATSSRVTLVRWLRPLDWATDQSAIYKSALTPTDPTISALSRERSHSWRRDSAGSGCAHRGTPNGRRLG